IGEITLPRKKEPLSMFTDQQLKHEITIGTKPKLFPKFVLETSLGGSHENFRITLPAKPSATDNLNLTLLNNCPDILDHLTA
ncbi:MAG TPA: hypothetical protein DEO70_12490, partial [Bacteroidales bacterium]|nr:hypothetical protein [Bacteroidales bacterium]